METLIVDHFSVISQEPHDNLEVIARVDILSHDIVVRPIEQDLAQQLDRLTLCNIAVGLDQHGVVLCEEYLKVCLQVCCNESLVLCEDFLSQVSETQLRQK
jgi:hypothetical protein